MGLGRFQAGSGSSAARFFAGRGARVTVTDLKRRDELKEPVARLRGLGITFVLGKHRKEDFRRADYVIRNPDVRSTNPLLALARRHGAKVVTDIGVFLEHCPPIWPIGVTGTRGKSTTTALVGEMLRRAGLRTYVGGNIQVSPLTFLDDLWRDYRKIAPAGVVLELSSWLLEGLSKAGVSLRIAVITNVMRDHLNTYPSMKEYIEAKAEIMKGQGKSGVAILNRENAITRRLAREAPGSVLWFGKRPFSGDGTFVRNGRIMYRREGVSRAVARVSDLRHLAGTHNLENALAAVTAAKVSGVPDTAVVRALRAFRGLPNRLERIRIVRGVAYYNDTTATTPDGTIAALRTLGKGKNIVLIAGGKDKVLEFRALARAIREQVKSLVLFEGTATAKIIWELRRIGYPYDEVPIVKDMRVAVRLAREAAKRGEVVLLSPGAASFGLFQNEFDRGAQFVKAVRKLV